MLALSLRVLASAALCVGAFFSLSFLFCPVSFPFLFSFASSILGFLELFFFFVIDLPEAVRSFRLLRFSNFSSLLIMTVPQGFHTIRSFVSFHPSLFHIFPLPLPLIRSDNSRKGGGRCDGKRGGDGYLRQFYCAQLLLYIN